MSEAGSETIYEFDGWRLMPGQRQLLSADGSAVTLRGKVFDLLLVLVQERGRVIDKAELMEAVWPNTVVEENNLNQAISALRQALGETAQEPRLIATITGRGYQFVGEVREVEPKTDPGSAEQGSAFKYVVAAVLVTVVAAGVWYANRPTVEQGIPVLEQFADLTPILVTNFEGSQSEPTLSPDGSMIAWISESSGTPQVWVKNLQSGDPIQVSSGPYAASSPTWTPDNSYIVYARKSDGPRAIYRVGTLGTPPPQQIMDAGLDPSFAMDADAFAITDGQRIFVADGDGENKRQVEAIPLGAGFAERFPALSPDASQVAFIHSAGGPLGNLWIAPVDGGEARQLTTFTIEDGFAALAPAWMPDGKHIVYSVRSRTGGSRLWQINSATLEAAPLTAGGSNASDPVVSSDGKRLAYTETRASWRITGVNPETGERRTIIESRYQHALPVVSPDGTEIVYFSAQPTGVQVFTVGVDGQNNTQWTFDEDGTNTLPFWASDGRSFFYYSGHTLRRLYRDEGRNEQVLDNFHWTSKNWAAAYGDRLIYNEFEGKTRDHRAVVYDFVTGQEVEMPVAVVAAEWSRDGSEIVANEPGKGLFICDMTSLECKAVANAGEHVTGIRPKWSRDGERIYFIRHSEKGECCTLWVVDRDGSDVREVVHLPGFETRNSYFGVDHEGMIFYNHPDESTAEIWLVAVE